MLKTKKALLWSMAIVGGIASLSALISCGASTGISARTETTKIKPDQTSIRIAVTDPDNPRWIKANNALLDSLEKNEEGGYANITKIQSEQNAWIEQSLANAKKPKGFIIAPENGQGAATVVSQAKQAGIPVVAYDRLIDSDQYEWYVSYDNYKVGELQGLSLAAGLLGKKEAFSTIEEMSTYVKANQPTEKIGFYSLGGSPNDNNAKLFYRGAIKVLNQLITDSNNMVVNVGDTDETKVLIDKWDYNTARQKMEAFFTTNQLISTNKFNAGTFKEVTLKGILAPNDGMATAAITAITAKQADPTKIFITGQDFNNASINQIESGQQNMTIYKPDLELSQIAVPLLLELINEKSNTGTKLTPEEIFKKVETKLKATSFKPEFKLDKDQYQTESGHKVNTILLSPVVVTKDNLEEIKKLEKN